MERERERERKREGEREGERGGESLSQGGFFLMHKAGVRIQMTPDMWELNLNVAVSRATLMHLSQLTLCSGDIILEMLDSPIIQVTSP